MSFVLYADYTNMSKVIHDDILSIHHFHERLDGTTLSCCMSFNKTIIKKKKWFGKGLYQNILANLKLVLDRITLQNIEKINNEIIKEYAKN
jgi:hypothetical protein